MTRADLEIVNDEIGQWTDTSRERMGDHWNRSGKEYPVHASAAGVFPS